MHYKTSDNILHWLDDDRFEYLLPAGASPISDKEAQILRQAQATAQSAPTPVDPVVKLKDFLATNPDVAALLGI